MPVEKGFKLVSEKFGNESAKTLAGYEKLGGYKTLRKALAMRPEDIVNEDVNRAGAIQKADSLLRLGCQPVAMPPRTDFPGGCPHWLPRRFLRGLPPAYAPRLTRCPSLHR